jgi:hypothetical protein
MSKAPEVVAAEVEARAARARLMETLGTLQERLKPSTLAHEAVESAAEGVASLARKGAEAARTHPLAIAGVAGTVGLALARHWIADLFRGRDHDADATRAEAEGLRDDKAAPASPAPRRKGSKA